jgi:hypothetical protein
MYLETAGIRLNESHQFRVVAVFAGHGIEIHLDAVAGSDHHIPSFGGHSSAFRELKIAGPG